MADRLAARIDGYQSTSLIYAAVKLSLPDRMGGESWSAGALAQIMGVDPDRLFRLLRALTALEICRESADRTFVLTEAGQSLQAGSASPLRERAILAVEQNWPAWIDLANGVQGGGTPYEQVFGMTPWQFRRQNPGLNTVFNAWCAKETRTMAAAIVECIDFGGVARVADIGGGGGGLLDAMLAAHLQLAAILFDQPHVVAEAEAAFSGAAYAGRIERVAGDFFVDIPVRADLFLLKSILHDWEDAEAGRILANCRSAMTAGDRLVLVERLLPPRATDATAFMLDIHMMAVLGGRERTLAEFESLLAGAGFTLSGVMPTGTGLSVIEAKPV